MKRHPRLFTAAATVAVALTATTLTARAGTPVTAVTPQPAAAHLNYDQVLAAVSTPGFGGVWTRPDGTLVVSLTKPSTAAARSARADLARLFGRPALLDRRVVAVPARYSFRQLKAWYDAIEMNVFALGGVETGDVDERAGVLRFGAVDPAALTSRIVAVAAAARVPSAAVVVDASTPAVPTSLDSITRPLVGGIRIDNGPGTCSIGFPAVRGGVEGFVTASHCTLVQGVVDHTLFWQTMTPDANDPTGEVPVAQETADPSGTVCGAPTRCRDSDSAFAALLDDTNFVAGTIARPPLNSTAWNGTDTYRVTSTVNPLLGDTVDKVGRTTGLTSGTITATCVNHVEATELVSLPGTFLWVEDCQDDSSYHDGPGDSGGPVFEITSGNDVALVGLNWGSTGSGGTFSPLANIEESTELGSMSVCATGFSC